VAGRVNLSVYSTASPFAALILAPGAGGGQRSSFIVAAAQAFVARGIATATFDFPYVTEGRKVPDRPVVLEATWEAAIEEARASAAFEGLPLFVGGKSMGGRIASQVVAQEDAGIAGLIFLGYPLHPPGKPQERRDSHLPAIAVPMLFVQGSRDLFGTADEIRAVMPRLHRTAQLLEIPGGDHSFKVPAKAGKPADVLQSIYDAVAEFMRATIE
jgi:uncharacterized protein